MTEDPFSAGLKSMMDFWLQAGKAMQQGQQDASKSLTEAMGAWNLPTALPSTFPKVDTEGLNQASEAVAQLWKAAQTLSADMAQSFLAAGSTFGQGGKPEPALAATFQTMTDPRNWLFGAGMDSLVGAVAQGPQLADLLTAERQQAKIMQAWAELRRRVMEHNAVVMQGWMRAAQAFGEEIAGRTKADGRAPEQNVALSIWTETANRVLLDVQRSDAFLQTQSAMIRSGADLKLAQRDLAERWAVQFGLPSRTELDDVHRSLTELRREFRAFKRKQTEPARLPASQTRQPA